MTGGFLFLVFFLIISVPAFLASPAQVWAADGDTPELCNGIDDDGDGAIDEGFDVSPAGICEDPDAFNLTDCCFVEDNGCKTAGKKVCSEDGKGTVCKPLGPLSQPVPEVLGTQSCFDGVDNDCDGLIDFADPSCQTSSEVGLCNGLDDDHDGQIDEDFLGLGDPCTVGVGFCQRSGTIVCSRDMRSVVCSVVPGSPSIENTPGTGNCRDGVDNDCDGLVDLADPGCKAAEVCDGQDNDGDRLADEDFPSLGTPCSAGLGACEANGVFVCSADQRGTVCGAIPDEPSMEGPGGITCEDAIDNDCDGLTDQEDPNCASANLAVSCALIPVKGKSGKPKPGEPGTSCEGDYRVSLSVNLPAATVTSELLALDADGKLLGSIPVRHNDLVHLASRIDPADFKINTQGAFKEVFAPVPLLRITANTGQRVVQAFSSPIPYLDVVKPSGEVISGSEVSITEVMVAIPRVDPKTLSVTVDGMDILGPLGINPVEDFPGGPYGGMVNINGYPVNVTELMVETQSINILSSNTLTMNLENLRPGGHMVKVDGEPLTGALPANVSEECHLDDILDTGTVSIFGIEITAPQEGEVIDADAEPISIRGEVRHGQPISRLKVNGVEVDVSGQLFTPGDGETSADLYVLPFNVTFPVADLAFGPQVGTLDRGQNEPTVGAEDLMGHLVFATRRFAIGPTVVPQILLAVQQPQGASTRYPESVPIVVKGPNLDQDKIERAFIFGFSPDGINKFYQGVCGSCATQKIEQMLKNKLLEQQMTEQFNLWEMIEKAFGDEVPPELKVLEGILDQNSCNPGITISVPNAESVRFAEGNLSCSAELGEGEITVKFGIPDPTIDLNLDGLCAYKIPNTDICLLKYFVDSVATATIAGAEIHATLNEDLVLQGGDTIAEYVDGKAIANITAANNKIECIELPLLLIPTPAGFGPLAAFTVWALDELGFFNWIVENFVAFDVGIQDMLKMSGDENLEINGIKPDEILAKAQSGLDIVTKITDFQIKPEGVSGTLSGDVVVTPPQDNQNKPQVTYINAPVPEKYPDCAKDAYFAISSDMFSLIFAGMALRGALDTKCVPGLTVKDLMPEECNGPWGTVTPTDNEKGRCKGAKLLSGQTCRDLGLSGDQLIGCVEVKLLMDSINISLSTPLLFCGRAVPDLVDSNNQVETRAPQLLIKDDSTTEDKIEAGFYQNKFGIVVVFDRVEPYGKLNDGDSNGPYSIDPNYENDNIRTIPSCVEGPDNIKDCKWAAVCLKGERAVDLTAGTSEQGKPEISAEIKGFRGDPLAEQCGGVFDIADIFLLKNAGASEPVEIVKDQLNSVMPTVRPDGLELGGYLKFLEEPKLCAIDVGNPPDSNCSTCQEYIGITGTVQSNEADTDSDGIPDPCDNCPDTPSLDQTDSDGDRVGDICDNCPNVENPAQLDRDNDGIGDACDN